MMLQMLGVFAEFERTTIVERDVARHGARRLAAALGHGQATARGRDKDSKLIVPEPV